MTVPDPRHESAAERDDRNLAELIQELRVVSLGVQVLFVGNLSYLPNRDAACVLVREVLPRLQQLLSGPVTVTLAGPAGQDGRGESARHPGCRRVGQEVDRYQQQRPAAQRHRRQTGAAAHTQTDHC